MQQRNDKTVEFVKNTSCDLLRILNNRKLSHYRGKTPLIVSDMLKDNVYVDKAVTSLSPVMVVNEINKLLKELAAEKFNESKVFRCLIRMTFSSKQVCYKYRLSRNEFEEVLRLIRKKFHESTGVPGEPVGPLGSHSISEPATQLTLNTFHVAGTSALGSLGLPRLKELIDFRNTKIPVMTIYMKDGPKTCFIKDYSEAKRRQMVQTKAIMRTAANIENAYFRDFVKTEEIIFDPDDCYEPDRDWLETGREMGFYTSESGSPFVLRYELSLRKLIEKEEVLRVEQIADKLETCLQMKHKNLSFQVSYYTGIGPQIIRIRSRDPYYPESEYRRLADELESLHISGLEAVKKVFQDNSTPFIHFGFDARFTPHDLADPRFGGVFRKDLVVKGPGGKESEEAVKELIIMTEGSDLLSVLGMPDVDATRTVVNDLPEVYATLGAEAARAMMVAEMAKTLPDAGLNPRHYPLLADVMMARPTAGRMVAINRNGMRDTNTGVLAQASFEQPGDAFLKAAAYALHDNA